MSEQKFIDTNTQSWQDLEQFPGTDIIPLAEPVPQGSIHRLRMKQGTSYQFTNIPVMNTFICLRELLRQAEKNAKQELFGLPLLILKTVLTKRLPM